MPYPKSVSAIKFHWHVKVEKCGSTEILLLKPEIVGIVGDTHEISMYQIRLITIGTLKKSHFDSAFESADGSVDGCTFWVRNALTQEVMPAQDRFHNRRCSPRISKTLKH